MAKFCGKCGSRLDETTGLCPNCDYQKPQQTEKSPKKSTKKTVKPKKKGGFWKITGALILLLVIAAGGLLVLMQREILPVPQWLPMPQEQASPTQETEALQETSVPDETQSEVTEATAAAPTEAPTQAPPVTEPPETLPPDLTLDTEKLVPPMNPVIQYTVSCATYNGDLADHSIHNLMDDNPKTNWTEGEDGLGEGESIEFLFREPYLVDSVSIRNGNHASKQRYLDNARPERMTLSFSDGTSETFVLRDEMELQIMDLPKPVETEFVKLTFDSVYPGARYEDTVISDVAFEAYEIRRDTVQVSGEGSVCGRIQVQTRYQLGKTDTEQTTIVGTDKNGDVIWTYDTNQCVSEYLESVIALLVRDNTLYFSNQGTVTALNIQDGTVRWSNSEFGGYPTDWVLDEEGNLYLCGYQSPDLFVVDAQGNTTLRVQQFDKAYYWPSQLTLSDNKLMIQMDGHPDNIAPGSSVISLDLISKGYELPLPSNWHSPW